MFRPFFHFAGVLLSLLCFLFCLCVAAQTKCIHCGWELLEGDCTNPQCRKAENTAVTCKLNPCNGPSSAPPFSLEAAVVGGSAAGVDVLLPMQNLELGGEAFDSAAEWQTTSVSGACAMHYSSQVSSQEVLDKIPTNQLLKHKVERMEEEGAVIALLDHIVSELHGQGVTVTRQQVIDNYIKKKTPQTFKRRLKPLLQKVQAVAVDSVYCALSIQWLQNFLRWIVKNKKKSYQKDNLIDEFIKASGHELQLVKRIGEKGDSGTVVMANAATQLFAGEPVVLMIQYSAGPEVVTLSPEMNGGNLVSVDFAHVEAGVHSIAAAGVHSFLMNLLTIDQPKEGGDDIKVVAVLRKKFF